MTPGRRASASASSMVSGRTVPKMPMETPWVLPGLTSMMLVPNWVNSASTNWRSPAPREVSRITAAMPTQMPNAVRKLRSRCASMARPTKPMRSPVFIPEGALASGQCHDRVEPGPRGAPARC
jgi:hypothetical protein